MLQIKYMRYELKYNSPKKGLIWPLFFTLLGNRPTFQNTQIYKGERRTSVFAYMKMRSHQVR